MTRLQDNEPAGERTMRDYTKIKAWKMVCMAGFKRSRGRRENSPK
jgi:hypothetical protein